MRLPEFITFTGLDQATDLDRAEELSHVYPVEWGVLFSASRAGLDPRYPTERVRESFLRRGLRMAAHLCGEYARVALTSGGGRAGTLLQELTGFSRVQINYVPKPQLWPQLEQDTGLTLGFAEAGGFADLVGRPVILQSRSATRWPSTQSLHTQARYYLQFLYDLSGGRGAAPAKWPPHPGGEQLVGYAGGLGPDNVAGVIRILNSPGPYWLDMEGRVRDENDFLDLDKVEAVCAAVYGASSASKEELETLPD